MLLSSFGASFLVDFTLGLQAECDLQVWQGPSATVHSSSSFLPSFCCGGTPCLHAFQQCGFATSG